MKQNTEIRIATEEDIPHVLELLGDLGYNVQDNSEFRRIWNSIFSNQSMGIVVAVTNNTISGYAAYSIKPQLRLVGLSLEIDELSVAKKFRGLGIGSELLNHIKKTAVNYEVKRILLSTNRERESYLRGFYTKHGFVEKNSAWMKLELS